MHGLEISFNRSGGYLGWNFTKGNRSDFFLTSHKLFFKHIIRFAGHDTTSVLLSMTFYALGTRPDIKQKMLAELEPLRSKDFVPNYDDLSSLSYIGMVLNETLRLYPPASSAR